MSFETLPSHNLQLPEFRPAPLPQAPVYNTSETIAPLLHLAEYLSPDARARRKAAVAKANYEYRAYMSGNPKAFLDPLFYLRRNLMMSEINLKNAEAKKKASSGEHVNPQAADRFKKVFGKDMPTIDYSSESTPPSSSTSDVMNLADDPTDQSVDVQQNP